MLRMAVLVLTSVLNEPNHFFTTTHVSEKKTQAFASPVKAVRII